MNRINFKSFLKNTSGLAMAESALLFPVLMLLTFGIYDLGHAIVLNQKVISAAQISADLIARERSITSTEIDQTVEAARLALSPYTGSELGMDIQGVKILDDGTPNTCWQQTTSNMTPNTVSAYSHAHLGDANEGFVMVTTRYEFTPYFTGSLLGTFDIEEVSFFRGRKTAFIPMEGVNC